MLHRALLTLVASSLPLLAQSPFVAHWLFDETVGTLANDTGPLANHGTLVNFGVGHWVPGQLGNALQFDGVDDYVDISTATELPVYAGRGTPFSVAFWVNAPAQSDRRVYSEQARTPVGNGPLFTLGSGSSGTSNTTQLRVFLRTDDAQTVVSEYSNAVVFDSTWHHVAYSDASGRVRIWVDGVLDHSYDYSHYTNGPRSASRGSYAGIDSVTFGAVVRNGNIAAPLAGMIDDMRVYNTALSDLDVLAIQAGSQPSFCTASLGEFGYGCGSGPLDLAATGSCAFGQITYVQLFRGEPGALALACFGVGALQPQDLSPLGFPGCFAYQPGLSCTVFGALGAAGSSQPFSVTVPNNPVLACTLFGIQGVTLGSNVEFGPVALLHLGN